LTISPTLVVRCIAFILRQLVRTVTVIHASRTQYVIDKPLQLIAKIRERHMKAGVAISPDTASTAITDEVGNAADMLLVMTVYPGSLNPTLFLSAL
jgi:pentose-5-phosphate-3-epimerase